MTVQKGIYVRMVFLGEDDLRNKILRYRHKITGHSVLSDGNRPKGLIRGV